MITRLRGLFRRYMIANLTLSGITGPIPELDGGRTTRIHWEAGRLSVEGHAPATTTDAGHLKRLELGGEQILDSLGCGGEKGGHGVDAPERRSSCHKARRRREPAHRPGLPGRLTGGSVHAQARSKRSAFITLTQAAMKSRTNFSLLSSCA